MSCHTDRRQECVIPQNDENCSENIAMWEVSCYSSWTALGLCTEAEAGQRFLSSAGSQITWKVLKCLSVSQVELQQSLGIK
jgi:hypothetical protein